MTSLTGLNLTTKVQCKIITVHVSESAESKDLPELNECSSATCMDGFLILSVCFNIMPKYKKITIYFLMLRALRHFTVHQIAI